MTIDKDRIVEITAELASNNQVIQKFATLEIDFSHIVDINRELERELLALLQQKYLIFNDFFENETNNEIINKKRDVIIQQRRKAISISPKKVNLNKNSEVQVIEFVREYK